MLALVALGDGGETLDAIMLPAALGIELAIEPPTTRPGEEPKPGRLARRWSVEIGEKWGKMRPGKELLWPDDLMARWREAAQAARDRGEPGSLTPTAPRFCSEALAVARECSFQDRARVRAQGVFWESAGDPRGREPHPEALPGAQLSTPGIRQDHISACAEAI